jgi:hypothetical protein
MALLISQTLFHVFLAFPITLSVIRPATISAPYRQSISAVTVFAKLTLGFPLSALAAYLLFGPVHNSMTLLTSEFLRKS